MLGTDLAEHIKAQSHGTPLGLVMESLAPQIEQDREALIELMRSWSSSTNPVKQATSWVVEKASRVKFSGMTSGDPELGTFMALEALALGVRGKACMWTALKQVADEHAPIASLTSMSSSTAPALRATRWNASGSQQVGGRSDTGRHDRVTTPRGH